MKKILLMASIIATSTLVIQAATANTIDMDDTQLTTTVETSNTTEKWNAHHGFYVEANGGTNLYFLGFISDAGSASSSGFEGSGWGAAVGYNFLPKVALEGGFIQNYAQYSEDGNTAWGHTNLPYITARFTMPLGDRFAFLAKTGLMAISVDAESSDANASTPTIVLPFIGLGASYALTSKLDITAQYQGAVYGVVNAGLLSAGLTYHFSS
jgi:opacity protein-like surface antigen